MAECDIKAKVATATDLGGLGWRVLPSHTNFLLCEVGGAAYELADGTLRQGMIMRTFPDGPLVDYIRVSVRSPSENAKLLAALS